MSTTHKALALLAKVQAECQQKAEKFSAAGDVEAAAEYAKMADEYVRRIESLRSKLHGTNYSLTP